jgi:hypothetical protein
MVLLRAAAAGKPKQTYPFLAVQLKFRKEKKPNWTLRFARSTRRLEKPLPLPEFQIEHTMLPFQEHPQSWSIA